MRFLLSLRKLGSVSRFTNKLIACLFVFSVGLLSSSALSEDRVEPLKFNMDQPVTPVAEEILRVHNFLVIVMTAIAVLVFVLIIWILFRYHRKNNPVPAKFSHNVPLEVFWTIAPIVILIGIGTQSFGLIYLQEEQDRINPDLVVKITGNQWFWNYEYPDYGISYPSFMLSKEELTEKGIQPSMWKKAVDKPLVVPVGANVVIQITSSDVIHSWSVPVFGMKIDAVPGRLNQSWFKAEKLGDFYGYCYELCGTNHAFMPVVVRVISEKDYEDWLVSNGANLTISNL